MGRKPGLSVRLKLTLSYAGFLVLAGVVLLALWAVVLTVFSQHALVIYARGGIGGAFSPGRSNSQQAFGELAAIVLGFLTVFGLIGGWFLAGRMLAPLSRITDATRKVAAGSMSHRIDMPGNQDEFRELADSFDAMLDQIEAHVSEQRRFAANASHELRTPLAIMRTLLDVARREDSNPTHELVETLHEVNLRAIDLTDGLLLLSRAEQKNFPRQTVDLSLLAEEAVETVLPLAEANDVTVAISGEVTTLVGSPTLLVQMVINLVHNAVVHNRQAAGHVWVETKGVGDSVVLVVENTGPSIDRTMLPSLTEPFRRGTDRIHTDQAGVGLGLAIVQRIIQAHRGILTLEPRDSGGLRVLVELPTS